MPNDNINRPGSNNPSQDKQRQDKSQQNPQEKKREDSDPTRKENRVDDLDM